MLTLKARTDGWWKFVAPLNSLTPFKTYGKFYGTDKPEGMGKLPHEWRDIFRGADYAVYSYNTPIAWYCSDTDQWYFPDTSYSITTTRHQGKILTALYDKIDREVIRSVMPPMSMS